jgi:hypothetical protein
MTVAAAMLTQAELLAVMEQSHRDVSAVETVSVPNPWNKRSRVAISWAFRSGDAADKANILSADG